MVSLGSCDNGSGRDDDSIMKWLVGDASSSVVVLVVSLYYGSFYMIDGNGRTW